MSVASGDVIPRTVRATSLAFRGVEEGAETYGYSERHFLRLLHKDIVIGARKEAGGWEAPTAVGSVGIFPKEFLLPKNTQGITVERLEGSATICSLGIQRPQSYIQIGALPGYRGSAGVKLVALVPREVNSSGG